jgi:RHS repeat-associated protein
VFFDNLELSHSLGRLVEENTYYPYGLKIAALSSKAFDAPKNLYLYQGDYAEFDEESGYNEFELRDYDAQIGRFVQTDPYEEFDNPYTGMGNDPVNNVDPSGGSILSAITGSSNILFNTAVSAIGGAFVGGVIGMFNGDENAWKKGSVDWGGGNLGGIPSMGIQLVKFGGDISQAGNQNFTLQDVINYGKGSQRFTSLLNQAGINEINYSSEISFGTGTVTSSAAPYKIKLKKTSLQQTTIGLTHELTNRINGKLLEKLRTDVGAGIITPEQYAERVLEVEANGVLNQIVVGSQLKMQASVAGNQPYYELYKSGAAKEDALIKSINKNIRKINLANGGGNAYDSYKKDGAGYRKAMKACEKQMEEYNKKYKKK